MKDVEAANADVQLRAVQIQRAPLNVNTAKMLCFACGVFCQPGDNVVLQNCLHNFCVKCLQACIRKEVVNVKCPFRTGCVGLLKTEEVNQLLAPFELDLLMKKRNSFDVIIAAGDIHKIPATSESEAKSNSTISVKNNNTKNEPEYEILQRSSVAEFNDLVKKSSAIAQQTVQESADAFCCGNCLKICAADAGFVLTSCGHTFCRVCLIGKITTSKTGIIICFFDDCKGVLSDQEIRDLLNADQIRVYDKILVI